MSAMWKDSGKAKISTELGWVGSSNLTLERTYFRGNLADPVTTHLTSLGKEEGGS